MAMLFSPPTGRVVELEGRLVHFCSDRSLPVGRVLDLALEVRGQRQEARVSIETCRQLSDGIYLHRGQAAKPLPGPESYRLPHPMLRAQPRFPCRFRVLSPKLPGFRGVTLDFNRTGLQLETEAPVEVGIVLTVTLEFDVCGVAPLVLRARVAWCGQQGRARYGCGLQFLVVDQTVRRRLERFERYLTGELTAYRLAEEEAPASPPPVAPAVDAAWTSEMAGRLESVTIGPEVRMRLALKESVELLFPDPQMVKAEAGQSVTGLRELRTSAVLSQVRLSRPVPLDKGFPYRHYQLLGADRQPVAEVISRKLRLRNLA